MSAQLNFPVIATDKAAAPAEQKQTFAEIVRAQYAAEEPVMKALAAKYKGVAFDCATTKGLDAAKAARLELREQGRFKLQRTADATKTEANDLKRVIDSESARLIAIVKPVEDEVDGQIKAEEERKEAEKAAKAEAERQRLHAIRVQIDAIKNHAPFAVGKSADAILKILSGVEGFDVGDDFQELKPEAEAAKADTLAKLKGLHAAQVEHEAEQARITAERAELARLRAEAEARERGAAAARAEQERKDREARHAVEAEQAAKLAAERAAQAEESRLAAERAELRRQQDEADAKRRADEEAKHAADIKARNAAPVMLAALQQIAELSTEAKVKKIAAAAIKEAL